MQEKENKIIGVDGEEYVQRKVDLGGPIRARKQPGKRVNVYNKYRSRIHCSDCILEPESEGSILQTDLRIPFIEANVIPLK